MMICSKTKHRSKKRAKQALKRLQAKRGGKRGSVYKCLDCGLFHITHYAHNVALKVRFYLEGKP